MPAAQMQAHMAQGMSPQQAYAAAYPGSPSGGAPIGQFGQAQGMMPQMQFNPGQIQLPGGGLAPGQLIQAMLGNNPYYQFGPGAPGYGTPAYSSPAGQTQAHSDYINQQSQNRSGGSQRMAPSRGRSGGSFSPMRSGMQPRGGNWLKYIQDLQQYSGGGQRGAGAQPGRPPQRSGGALPGNQLNPLQPASRPGGAGGDSFLADLIQQILARYGQQGGNRSGGSMNFLRGL